MDAIIFDVDGTLTRTNELDMQCYARAVDPWLDLEGLELSWEHFEYVTAAGATRELIERQLGPDSVREVSEQIRGAFAEEVRRAVDGGAAIEPIDGAADTLEELRAADEIAAGIATGDWRDSSQFKLERAGLSIDGIAYACSDDALARAEIIRTALERAGGDLGSFDRVVYVGDGVWDLRAAQELGVDFIGVGREERAERLREGGAETVVGDLSRLRERIRD